MAGQYSFVHLVTSRISPFENWSPAAHENWYFLRLHQGRVLLSGPSTDREAP